MFHCQELNLRATSRQGYCTRMFFAALLASKEMKAREVSHWWAVFLELSIQTGGHH